MLELETEGRSAMKNSGRHGGDAVAPPSFGLVERRLHDRDTESAREIDERLALARSQTEEQDDFDHVVVNDDLGRAATRLDALLPLPVTAGTERRPAERRGGRRECSPFRRQHIHDAHARRPALA